MKKILFIEFWNIAPHFHTALEIAKNHLDAGDKVFFYFAGHDTPYIEDLNVVIGKNNYKNLLPEIVGAKLLKSNNFYFYPRCKFTNTKYLYPKYFKNINELMGFQYKGVNLGEFISSSLISDLKNSNPDTVLYKSTIIKMLISAIKIFEFTLKKINQHKIDRVYVFNGRFCNSGAVAQAAQFLNCELYFHERGATKEKYFLENFMPHDTIKMQNLMIQTWKNAIRENSQEAIKTARKFFIDSKDKKEIGWIALNKNQHSGLIPNLDNSKKNITYFSSCDDEFAALPHLLPWKFWNNQMDAVLDLIDICKNNPNISLYIRLHPHLGQKSNEDLQKWLNLSRFKHVNIISPFEAIDSHKLAAESALVITSGSTMGIESVFQGTPCIVLGPSFYSELNATYHPESKAQLIKLMNAKLEAVPTKTYPFGYFYMTFGSSFNFFEPIDLFSGTFLNNTLLDEIPKPTLIDKIFKFFLAKPK